LTLINGLPFLLIGVFTPVWFGEREKGMNFELLHSPSSLVHPLVSNESMLGCMDNEQVMRAFFKISQIFWPIVGYLGYFRM
jgi:hypothetical protein